MQQHTGRCCICNYFSRNFFRYADEVLSSYDDPRITTLGMLFEAHAEAVRTVDTFMDNVAVPPQFISVLIRLARSPGEEKRMTDLAKDMTISTSGLTRLIDRMEAQGFVERVTCPDDRRGFNARVTDKGRDVLAEAAVPHLDAIEAAVTSHLTEREAAQLTRLLRKVRDGNRAACPEND